jgi:hypothetical protein
MCHAKNRDWIARLIKSGHREMTGDVTIKTAMIAGWTEIE